MPALTCEALDEVTNSDDCRADPGTKSDDCRADDMTSSDDRRADAGANPTCICRDSTEPDSDLAERMETTLLLQTLDLDLDFERPLSLLFFNSDNAFARW
mmetsp:Transcript_123614/g.219044  ORF Transcript_123614/g.219044 Transcript_123614/m.219044 type:complete len:100 (-) Transcript_123614:316-615(-)